MGVTDGIRLGTTRKLPAGNSHKELSTSASSDEDSGLDTDVPDVPSLKSHPHVYDKAFRRRRRWTIILSTVLGCLAIWTVRSNFGSTQEGQRNPVSGNAITLRPQASKPADGVHALDPRFSFCDFGASPVCPARTLFDSPEVIDAAAEVLMAVGSDFLQNTDPSLVREMAQAGLKNISIQLSHYVPETARRLDVLQLSAHQKDAVLASLRLVANPKVRSLGLDVAKAIRGNSTSLPSTETEDIRKRIVEHLLPRRAEIQALRKELVPESVDDLWGKGHEWEMTLEPENVAMMLMVRGEFAFLPYVLGAAESDTQKVDGIAGGLAEEGRALFDMIKLCTRVFGHELDVPAWVTSLSINEGKPGGVLPCEHEAVHADATKALLCPLKFGTQGLDALRAAFTLEVDSEADRHLGHPPEHTRTEPESHIGHPPEHVRTQTESHIGHPPEHSKIATESHVGHPPEHTRTEETLRVGHPPEHTRSEETPHIPPEQALHVGHPPEHPRTEETPHVPPEQTVHVGHPPEHTRTEETPHIPPEQTVHVGHPPEHTRTEAESHVGHPPEHTRTEGMSRTGGRPPKSTRKSHGTVCAYGMTPVCPAMDLFESPEVLEAVSQSLMSLGEGLLSPSDERLVQSIVATSFRNISTELQEHAPGVARELEMMQLSELQKDSVIQAMRLVADPRVQSIGLDVSRAIRDCDSTEREELKTAIEAKLRSRLKEVVALKNELVPGSLRALWGSGHQWDMTLDPESVKTMQRSDRHLVHDPRAASSVDLAKKSYSILGGVLEEGRALLDAVKLCTRVFGGELVVPHWATTLIGKAGPKLESCDVDAGLSSKLDFMKALFCPLKFGTAGLDALRAATQMAEDDARAQHEDPSKKSPTIGHPPEHPKIISDDNEERSMMIVGHPPEHTRVEHQEASAKHGPSCSYKLMPVCPASDLFESPEIQAVVTASLLRVGPTVLKASDEELVRRTVGGSFTTLMSSVSKKSPEALRHLQMLQLSKLQTNAVLTSLWLVSDFRVQAIGRQVAVAIRDSPSEKTEDVKATIERHMKGHMLQVKNLRDELVPAALLELWGEGRQWEMTLEPENIQSVRMGKGKMPGAAADKSTGFKDENEKTSAIIGGTLEEGRALLDLVRLTTRLGVEELAVPMTAASLAGEDGPQAFECSIGAQDVQQDAVDSLYCPLKFGTHGLDALRAVSHMAADLNIDETGSPLEHGSAHSFIGHPPEHSRIGEKEAKEEPEASGKKHIGHPPERTRPERSLKCVYSQVDQCNVPDFLGSPELLEVATVSLMRVGRGLLAPADVGAVRDTVAAGFANISKNLVASEDELDTAVRELSVDKNSMHAMLSSLWLMSDPRVQSVGREVAKVIHESDASISKDELERSIVTALEPHAEEMAGLRGELVPPKLLELWARGPKWELTLSPENIRAMRSGSGDFDVSADSLGGGADIKGKSYSILGGVLEEGRALLDVVALQTGLWKQGLASSEWNDKLAGKVSLGFDSCQHTVHSTAPLDFMQSIFCPLKFGVQGLDAMRASDGTKTEAKQRPALSGQLPHEATEHVNGDPQCKHTGLPMCRALDMFESPELVDVVSETILRVGKNMFKEQDDRDLVKDVVTTSLKNISLQLQLHVPEVAKELDSLLLSELEKNAVLSSLQLLGNAEVQEVGLLVAEGIHEAALAEKDFNKVTTDYVSNFLEEKLRPRLPELTKLRKTLVPNVVKDLWGKKHQWEMTLDPENIGSMLGGDGQFISEFHMSDSMDREMKKNAVLGAVLEEGKAIIDLIKVCTRSYGKDLSIPPWATSMTGRVSPDLLSCQFNAKGDKQAESMKTLYCPLKYGSQGAEALKAVAEMKDKFVIG